MMLKEEVEKTVQRLCEPIMESFGLELVQVQYRREATGWILRVLLDRPGGVSVDDCAAFSRELSDVLDVEELIPTTYNLEVSSPGLDRPLTKKDDYLRYTGRCVSLKTREPISGRRNFKGILEGIQDDRITVTVDGQPWELVWSQIEKANLVPDMEK